MTAFLIAFLLIAACSSGSSTSGQGASGRDDGALLERKAAHFESLLAWRGAAAGVWSRLMRALPDRVWLTEVTYSSGKAQAKGRASSNDLLADYLAGLERDPTLADVVLRSSLMKSAGGREWQEFTIDARAASPGGEPAPAGRTPAERLKKLEESLRAGEDSAAARLRELRSLALDSGVQVVKYAPGNEVKGEFTTALPVVIEIVGDRRDIPRFLSGLDGPVRTWIIERFSLRALSDGDPRAKVRVLIGAKTYRPAAHPPGCSTVVVGKKASLTGEVLLGHNEDNEGRLVVACYRMPRLKHAPGEMIVAEEGKAKIPQVAETAAYLWWETIADWKASFSDDFVNEYGVAVVSDSCWPSKEEKGELSEGGIGYALRRIVAERARTAREGVNIAAALVDRYGYADSGRTYIIADKNEGWLFEVVMGKHYAARRVADDEVAFIPNWYTIHEVDFKDKERWVVSPDLVSYAAMRGWFSPKAPGEASGFDFAKAYMSPLMYDTHWKVTTDLRQDYNVLRHKYALEMITGGNFAYGRDYPFAVKPARKLGLEDLMALFRTHYEGKPDYRTTSSAKSPHSLATICSVDTRESLIVQFRENPDLTVVWWTEGRPCTSAFVPWYLGIQRVPDGYGWKDPVEAMKKHFMPPPDDLATTRQRAWWAFADLQNELEPRYCIDRKGSGAGADPSARGAGGNPASAAARGDTSNEVLGVQATWRKLEKEWLGGQRAVEEQAVTLGKKSHDAFRDYLTGYTADQAKRAWAAAREMADRLRAGGRAGKTGSPLPCRRSPCP